MRLTANLGSLLRRAGAAIWLSGVAALAQAAPVWQESAALQSQLDNNFTYSSDSASRTATIAYTNQTATNTSGVARQMGMYLAWAWSYDSSGAATSLPWSNGSNAFVGGDVSLQILGANGSVVLGSVVDDSWIGNPWGPGGAASPIATDASWEVPLYDFGVIAAGGSVSYDISLQFTFASDAAFADWDRGGDFYLGGQGVQAVPEPGSLALVALALLGAAAALRRPSPGHQAD